MKSSQQLLIGLPGSGKTTFLAALWHVVDANDVTPALRLVNLHGDRTYLNHVRRSWLKCQSIERTIVGREQSIALQLAERDGIGTTELRLPDMSGETFRLQWRDRQWTPEFGAMVAASIGGLLVLHPHQVQEPVAIEEADALCAELDPTPGATLDEPFPWDPDHAPTQTQLVDLLQFLANHTQVIPFRLSVIVSAWDLIESQERGAEAWCEHRLPLLYQFLRANGETFVVRYYGVSAQGGDFSKDQERLQRIAKPSTRIRIEGTDCSPHDVSAPVRWVMG